MTSDRAQSVLARASACVKACQGIDDPEQLRAQRDALLEACKGAMLGITQQSEGFCTIGRNAVDILRSAISLAEGGA